MRYLPILLSVILLSGCSSIIGQRKPPKQDFTVRKVEEKKPVLMYTSGTPRQKLATADSYFDKKKYDKAIACYQEIEKLHPKDDIIPYCIYQIGLSYYNQTSTFDRDQTYTRKALEEFKRLKQKFPDYKFMPQVDKSILQCRKNLAEQEFYVAEFYFKTKHYPAAEARYVTLIKEYPEFSENPEAQLKIAECQRLKSIKPDVFLFGVFDAKW